MKEQDLTFKVIGAAMEVHKQLGNGFQEFIYQRCLALEMQLQNISFVREQVMKIEYKGYDVGTRRVDFLLIIRLWLRLKRLSI